jgi:phosphatidylserine decarboxylase
MRAVLLTLLPKVLLSRTTGLVTRLPMPRRLRAPVYSKFARRYGAVLGDIDQPLDAFASLAAFFQRPLARGARPIASAPLVWPCDGRVVSAGPLAGGAIPQVKGRDYALADLLGDAELASALAGGSQVTIYLAPGDYHRVHAPFAATVQSIRPIGGTLFPVNPGAVASIDQLFVRNARVVFDCALEGGRRAAVVMVGALNVGDLHVTATAGARVAAGDELGRFGFGSTTVALVDGRGVGFAPVEPGMPVRMGGAAPVRASP